MDKEILHRRIESLTQKRDDAILNVGLHFSKYHEHNDEVSLAKAREKIQERIDLELQIDALER